jgi:UDP-glucose 4-epimerase
MTQRARRVVVTGGAGFIGSHLVDRLLADGAADVVVLDNFSHGRLENLAHLRNQTRFSLIEADIRDLSAMSSAFGGADLVYHLAAQSSVLAAAKDLDYTFQTNVVGTFNVLRAAAACAVPRVVFASSCEVYGEPISLPVDENSPLLAINSFGASKVAGEVYCRAFRREFGLQTVVLRLASVYGTRDVGRLVPLWLRQARSGHGLQVYGGKQVLDFVWVGNVVEALVRAGELDGSVPPINIGSGTGTRIIDLARRIARLAECQPKIQFEPARPMEVTRMIANVERMREILLIDPPLDPLANLTELLPAPVALLA